MLSLPKIVLLGLLPVWLPGLCADAQTTPPVATLQTGTQLVVVDVVVHDGHGNPIHGLTAGQFQVADGHLPQVIRNFDEHTAATAKELRPSLPKLPPGTFTDYTTVPPGATLNILLLDALNTPTKDQTFVRQQLQEYVRHAAPGSRMAIFGLATRLVLLQGFTADPELLKDAVEHKLIPRSSPLLDDPSGSGQPPDSMADTLTDIGAPAAVAASVAQFEAQAASQQTEVRIQRTLDAFNTLGHYLAGLPGRKNLIWFSGSFPIDILPDASIQDPFATVQVNEEEFRQTTSLLSRADVAVYPIDARGLLPDTTFSVANPGRNYAANPSRIAADIGKFNQSQADEHTTMEALANDTGGHAFYNTNGLAEAVAQAIDAGANYYTFSYTPTAAQLDGRYHPIHVELSGVHGPVTLSYRRGYFADRPAKAASPAATTPAAAATPPAAAATPPSTAYRHAAMDRGAPTPQDILFKVRVLPASATPEAAVAVGNTVDPNFPMKGPFERFAVDFASLPGDVQLTALPDGVRTGQLQFLAFLYDGDGRLLNVEQRAIALHIKPEEMPRFLHSQLAMRLEISAPVHRETFLRLGIWDPNADHMGVVEVPIASVSRLPPGKR